MEVTFSEFDSATPTTHPLLQAPRTSPREVMLLADKIAGSLPLVIMLMQVLLRRAVRRIKGKPFDNSVILNAALSNIIVSILFNHHYEYDDPKLLKLLTTTSEINRNAGTPMAQLYNAFPSLVRWLPGSHKVVLANAEELHSIIRGILMNQMDQLSVNDQKSFVDAFLLRQKESEAPPEKPNFAQFVPSPYRAAFLSHFHDSKTAGNPGVKKTIALLSRQVWWPSFRKDAREYVQACKERPDPRIYFSNENLTTLVVDLLLAGTETTAITLQWGLLLMMKYPEIQKNVQDEIHRVIGSREPCFAHRKQMPYTDAVIHEIQRFANVIPVGIPRSTTQDLYFKGFFIPKGTHIALLLYSVLRDKEYFEKPEKFYPQHFLDSDGNFVNNEAYIPFAAGKRGCVGENLAKMELFLYFTTLLQHFTFQAPPGVELDLTADFGFTTSPLKHEICAIPQIAKFYM
ncbi:cytochrome P450 2C15-like [Gastrophryne carolinensis]